MKTLSMYNFITVTVRLLFRPVTRFINMPWLHGLRKPGTNSKKRLIIAKINLSRKVPNVTGICVKNYLKKHHIQNQSSGDVL